MFKYAQINVETGICVGVSYLSGEVKADNLIPLSIEENVNPGDTYLDGVWTPAPPPEPPASIEVEPQPDKINQLEVENADLKARLTGLELAFAKLMGQEEVEVANVEKV